MNNFQKIIVSLIGVVVIAIVYYFLSVLPEIKQQELDLKAREMTLQEEKQRKEQELKDSELQLKQEKESEILLLEKEKNCSEKALEARSMYNNYNSYRFDKYSEICFIRYENKSGEIEEAPVENLILIKEKPIPIPLFGDQTVVRGVNLREYPVNGGIIQEIDPSNKVRIKSYRIIDRQLWYEVEFFDKEGWISSVAFGQ